MNVVVRTADGPVSLQVDDIGDVLEVSEDSYEPLRKICRSNTEKWSTASTSWMDAFVGFEHGTVAGNQAGSGLNFVEIKAIKKGKKRNRP